MKKEKVILSFIAVAVGLLCAGIAFYFYQSSKVIPPSKTKTVSVAIPTPTIKPSQFLIINEPTDEEVVDNKTVTVSGQTTAGSAVAIYTDSTQQVIQPSQTGTFSTTVTIGSDENLITITSFAPNGEEQTVHRIVTFSSEDF